MTTTTSWIACFLATKGNEYFCEVDEDWIEDRFNLTGLNAEVPHYNQALETILSEPDVEDFLENSREEIETSARHLYGLIHARFILTHKGLEKMAYKYEKGAFGRCPRVLCAATHLLPVGLSDLAHEKSVKLFCPMCEDIYNPKSSKHGSIDGAYFGTTLPHLLLMTQPKLIPIRHNVLSNYFSSTVPTSSAPGAGAGAPNPTVVNRSGVSNASTRASRSGTPAAGSQVVTSPTGATTTNVIVTSPTGKSSTSTQKPKSSNNVTTATTATVTTTGGDGALVTDTTITSANPQQQTSTTLQPASTTTTTTNIDNTSSTTTSTNSKQPSSSQQQVVKYKPPPQFPHFYGDVPNASPYAAAHVERFRVCVFGFQVHNAAKLMRWQEAVRNLQVRRLENLERKGLAAWHS